MKSKKIIFLNEVFSSKAVSFYNFMLIPCIILNILLSNIASSATNLPKVSFLALEYGYYTSLFLCILFIVLIIISVIKERL